MRSCLAKILPVCLLLLHFVSPLCAAEPELKPDGLPQWSTGQHILAACMCTAGWIIVLRFLWLRLQPPLLALATQEDFARGTQKLLSQPAGVAKDAQLEFIEMIAGAGGAFVLAPLGAGVGAAAALPIVLITTGDFSSPELFEAGAYWGCLSGMAIGFLGTTLLAHVRLAELAQIRDELRQAQAQGPAARNQAMARLWSQWEQQSVAQSGRLHKWKRRAMRLIGYAFCMLVPALLAGLGSTLIASLRAGQNWNSLVRGGWISSLPWTGGAAIIGALLGVPLARISVDRLLLDCPYDRRSRFMRRRWSIVWASGRDYDIFISYKTEDAALARRVAEALLARGVVPWFAEYVIGLDDDRMVDRRLADGVRRARYGLLLTNSRWGQSHYCRNELVGLLEHGHPSRLLQVKCPDETLGQQAAQLFEGMPIHTMTYEGDLDDVLRFIAKHTNLIAASVAPQTPSTKLEGCRHRVPHASVDLAGWGEPESAEDPIHGQVLRGEVQREGGTLRWNVLVQERPDWTPRDAPESGEVVDDRKWLQQIRQYAQEHSGTLATHCRGFHLVFKDGYSHQAVTYAFAGAWIRRYSLVLPAHGAGPNLEFAFVFRFSGKFVDLVRHTPEMERLVMSLELDA